MRKVLILFVIVLFSFHGFSRNFKFIKLEELYSQGQYDKCIELAAEISEKKTFKDFPEPYYYKAVSYLKKSKQTTNQSEIYYNYSNAMFYFELAKRKDSKKELTQQLYSEYQLLQNAEDASKKTVQINLRKSSLKANYRTEIYQDSTGLYLLAHSYWHFSTDSLNNLRRTILSIATNYLGVRYRRSGMSEKGFDCSGFTSYVYNKAGVYLPHGSSSQAVLGETIELKDAQPGDLIIFGYKRGKSYRTSHSAIVYSNENGDLQIIHSVSHRGVLIDNMQTKSWKNYWSKRILFVKRIL